MRTHQTWREMALVAGVAASVAVAVAMFGLRPSVGDRLREAEEDVDALHRAIASMALDFCGGGRPAYVETGCTDGSQPVYTFRMGWTAEELHPDFRIPDHFDRLDPLDSMLRNRCLTTPTAYAQSYPTDPFTGDGYGYWPAIADEGPHPAWWDGSMQGAYVITSAGPDGCHEIDQLALCLACLGTVARRTGMEINERREERFSPVSPEFANQLYDPTNGARSAGDLAWICGHEEIQNLNAQGAYRYWW